MAGPYEPIGALVNSRKRHFLLCVSKRAEGFVAENGGHGYAPGE